MYKLSNEDLRKYLLRDFCLHENGYIEVRSNAGGKTKKWAEKVYKQNGLYADADIEEAPKWIQ